MAQPKNGKRSTTEKNYDPKGWYSRLEKALSAARTGKGYRTKHK